MCTNHNTLLYYNFFDRSIEELQEQNQKLLEIVRDLSEKKESDEKHATEIK